MNETTPFLQSWIFDLILLFGGAIVGYIACAICCISGQASRDEERWEKEAKLIDKNINNFKEKITKGMPDRE